MIDSEQIVWSDDGFPVLMAEVPNSGAVTYRETGSRGGNVRHDAQSGKFQRGPKAKQRTPPSGVSRADYARMLDAVREAARSFSGELTTENLQSFINKRAKNPGAVDMARFAQMVSQQQIDDVVDMISGELNKEKGPKLKAPRGYIEKVLAGQSEDSIAEIVDRLEAMGHEGSALQKYLRKVPKDKQQKAQEKKQDIQASWDDELFDDQEIVELYQSPQFPGNSWGSAVVELAESLKNMPAPEVHVHPQISVEAPKPIQREVVRDENGLVVGIKEVE